MNKSKLSILIVLALIIGTGCSPQIYDRGQRLIEDEQYNEAVTALTDAIREQPDNYRLWQELGIAQFKLKEYDKAEESFKRSGELKTDPRTDLYLGLVYEEREFYGRAIDAYRRALAEKPNKKIREAVNDRLDRLIVKKLDYEATQAVTNESKIKTDTIPDNTVGVVDFDAAHVNPDLAPLAKGLAEFTALDLAKVKQLKVVDRLKIEMILNELKLSNSEYADRTTGPRLGKLIGSSRLVTGSMTGIGDDELRLDGAVVTTADSTVKTTGPSEGQLQNIFKIQKEFVYKVLDEMGIPVSAQLRDSIDKTPTDSYLAFLAYCRGLDFRSRGMYREAAEQFNNAVQIDGNFGAAKTDAEQAKALSQAPQSPQSFETVVAQETSSGSGDQNLGSFQSANLSNNGFIRNLNNLNNRRGSPEIPPRPTPEDNSVIIFIRGTFDVPSR